MTALERIKEIENYNPDQFGGNIEQLGCTLWISGDFSFYVKAFQVMREIAAKRSCKCTTANIGYCFKEVDQEFEDRMKGVKK